MKKSPFQAYLFSTVGVVVMLLLLMAVYVIAGVVKFRADITEEKLYTLSPGTEAVLDEIDTPVEIRFYFTQDSKAMPVRLKSYAQQVEDLLAEYVKLSDGMIEVKKFDPEPDSDAEDSANLDGVQGQMLNMTDRIYLGLAVSMLDSKVAIPFLPPEREKFLEYDITRAISSVLDPEKPKVGVMSSLPVFGMPMNPMMMRMGQQGQEPWVFISELQRDFDVEEVDSNVEEIPEGIDVLMIVHPKNLADQTLYAIDQYLLGGGRLVVFVDPMSLADARNSPQNNPLQAAASGASNMEKLFRTWGLQFDDSKVVADLNFISRINQGGQIQVAPAVLSMTQEGVNPDDVVTSQIDNLLLPFPGAFSGRPAEGLTQTVLLHTTERAQQVDRFMAQFSGQQIVDEFNAAGDELPLALRLTGRFNTAFPDGKPSGPSPSENEADEQESEASETESTLGQSTQDGMVILVGDTDLLYDQFSVRILPLGGRVLIPINQNLNLVQNVMDQAAGDSNLIAVRTRATMNRPFTVVRDMQAEAEDRYRSKIRELEQSLADAQSKLNDLQQEKDVGQQFIISPAQQAEIERFKKKEAEIKRDLKEVRRNLRKDVDYLENFLKGVNIAAMPLVVTLFGVGMALIKRKRTAAK